MIFIIIFLVGIVIYLECERITLLTKIQDLEEELNEIGLVESKIEPINITPEELKRATDWF